LPWAEIETVKPFQNEPPVAIVADDRERASEVIEHLRAIPGVAVGIERLAAGDYQADRKLLFERKTLRDFSLSIVDGRLFKQMGALARTRSKAVLIEELLSVEGVGARTADRIRWAVSEHQALYGCDPDRELERLGSEWLTDRPVIN
jgi:hypothetical protein